MSDLTADARRSTEALALAVDSEIWRHHSQFVLAMADLIDTIDQGLAAHLDLCGYDSCDGCRVAEDVRALIHPEDES